MRKINLFHNVSSLYKMNYSIGETQIFIKRDDILDFAFGGNKVRLFEYIAAVIEDSKAKRIVTYGSVFSNYTRVAAAVCAELNVECDIIVLDEKVNEEKKGGNATLLEYYDANIIHCSLEEASKFIDEYQEKLRKEGISFLWIPGGGHIPEASFAYVDVAKEIKKQMREQGEYFDAIFLPCGTGTTQAGLIYGMSDTIVEVYGITVSRTVDRCEKEIEDTLIQMKKLDTCNEDIKYKINVLKGLDIKYGEVNDEIGEIIKEVAISDGIFLDPIYNAKAFGGMVDFLKDKKNYKKVLYINTGGLPNIFLTKG